MERITDRLLFILQQTLYLLCLHSFYLAFYLLYKPLLPSWHCSLAFLTPLLCASFNFVASHTANAEQGRNMDWHTHGAFRKLKGWHTALTFTAVRQRKCEESVYTRWELPQLVLSCADREGATDGHPCYPSGCCGNRYLHAHLHDGQTHHTQCSLLAVSLVEVLLCRTTGLSFLQGKMYYKWKKSPGLLFVSLVQPNVLETLIR